MKYILQEIIEILTRIRGKIRRLNHYWNTSISLTISTANGSGYTVQSSSCTVMGNMMQISIGFQVSAQKASGTSIRAKVCSLTITGVSNVCSINNWVPQMATGVNGSTGPIVSGQLINGARANADTITYDFYLGGNCGGPIPTGSTITFRFLTPIPRKVTL